VLDAIVGGDGYFYVAYQYGDWFADCTLHYAYLTTQHLRLLRTDSAGNSTMFDIDDWSPDDISYFDSFVAFYANMITNADTGILLSWELTRIIVPEVTTSPNSLYRRPTIAPRDAHGGAPSVRSAPSSRPSVQPGGQLSTPIFGMAVTTGTSVTLTAGPQIPGQYTNVQPVLQAEDGSFVGDMETLDGCCTIQDNMVAFDASGNVRWVVPNEQPQIATDDGGVIGASGITYDANGNATGQIPNMPTYSWLGYQYKIGSVESTVPDVIYLAASWRGRR